MHLDIAACGKIMWMWQMKEGKDQLDDNNSKLESIQPILK
jgi:hypothetical protein